MRVLGVECIIDHTGPKVAIRAVPLDPNNATRRRVLVCWLVVVLGPLMAWRARVLGVVEDDGGVDTRSATGNGEVEHDVEVGFQEDESVRCSQVDQE